MAYAGQVLFNTLYKPHLPHLTTARSGSGDEGPMQKHTEEHGVSLATKLEETMDARFKPRYQTTKLILVNTVPNQVGRMGI